MAEVDDALDRLFELALAMADLTQRGLPARALTRARGHVITQLYRAKTMTQRELAELLGVTPRNVTGLLDALQAAELVSRAAHPTDRRATMVSLTTKGNRLAAALRADHHTFAKQLFAELPNAELASLQAYLDRLTVRLHQIAPITSQTPDQ
jgi:DNA-binding MarR family transcriptional regulator